MFVLIRSLSLSVAAVGDPALTAGRKRVRRMSAMRRGGKGAYIYDVYLHCKGGVLGCPKG